MSDALPWELTAVVILLAAIPPSVFFLVSIYVGLMHEQAVPSSIDRMATGLCSFWSDAGGGFAFAYLVFAIIGFTWRRQHWVNYVLACSFVSSLIGYALENIPLGR